MNPKWRLIFANCLANGTDLSRDSSIQRFEKTYSFLEQIISHFVIGIESLYVYGMHGCYFCSQASLGNQR